MKLHTTFKESMINRLSNLINHNRPAAKISQVLCSSTLWPNNYVGGPKNRIEISNKNHAPPRRSLTFLGITFNSIINN